MKIACLSASRVPSAAANSIQVMKVCQALAQLGNEVTLLVPDHRSSLIRCPLWNDLTAFYGLRTPFAVTWLPGPRRLFPWLALRRARTLQADLLYAWPIQSAVFSLFLGLPVILEMHDLPTGLFGPLWYRLFLRMRGRKRLIVITDALRRALQRAYGTALPPEDVIIAPNGVDLERFASLPDPKTARRQLGLPSAPTVVCTGHLYVGRGADLFLALAKGTPQAHFLWAGGRPQDMETWKSRAAALGLTNVTFTGFIPNERLPLYQAAADVLLMPYGRVIAISSAVGQSAEIASPMKMFEYMAAGRAIITSNLPVIREVLNESNAVFCPPEDIPAWQAVLTDLLADSGRRKSLARQARRDAERYTWLERARRALQGLQV